MIDKLRDLLPGYLSRQRWYAGSEPESVEILAHRDLAERLLWLLVADSSATYQVLIGTTEGAAPDFLHGHEGAVAGVAGKTLCYDALLDADLAKALLGQVAPDEAVMRVRPMGGEQSNTSLVFDDRLVLKVFRRIHDGPNPDIEVTSALAAAGFPHVAAPVATWEHEGAHLAVVQPFLGGGTDGWSMALTSLRDYYGGSSDQPAECGGDFGAEASRLGEVTARMHVALGHAFGVKRGDSKVWLAGMERQLDRVGGDRPWVDGARESLSRLRELVSPGSAIRVHGDYHLGQVLRTDTGWFVLDFEGEPARPLVDRRLPSSPLKDVAGMLRSFHYATAVALRERPPETWESFEQRAERWERRNRAAFLEGYLATDGITALLPVDIHDTLLAVGAWELDKAIYEVAYELDHRPDWVAIPEGAVTRLVAASGRKP